MVTQKATGRAMSMPAGLMVGGGISLGITILLTAAFAWLLNTERLQWEKIGYWIMGMLLIGSFSGAMTACGKIKRQRLLVSLLSGALYMGTLLAITALFFGGQYDGVVVTAILVMGGSLAAGLLGLRGGRKNSGTHKRYHT